VGKRVGCIEGGAMVPGLHFLSLPLVRQVQG
jgi:hypothetical protein